MHWTMLLSLVLLAGAVVPCAAADLGAGRSFSEIFAPAPVHRARRPITKDADVVVSPWVNNSPRVPGYYGRAGDFYYSPYYNTPPEVIWGRLPYACKFYASC